MVRLSQTHGKHSRERQSEWRMEKTSVCTLTMRKLSKMQMAKLHDFLDLYLSPYSHILVS